MAQPERRLSMLKNNLGRKSKAALPNECAGRPLFNHKSPMRRAPLPARLPAAAEALFEVRREAARGDLAPAPHARDLLQRRGRVRLPKHVRRAPRAGERRERLRRRRGWGRRRRGEA